MIVATAYMDEAERFDWLVAMNGGKVIATGTTAQILKKTGETTLEEAFIALLPEEERAQHQRWSYVHVPLTTTTCRPSRLRA